MKSSNSIRQSIINSVEYVRNMVNDPLKDTVEDRVWIDLMVTREARYALNTVHKSRYRDAPHIYDQITSVRQELEKLEKDIETDHSRRFDELLLKGKTQ